MLGENGNDKITMKLESSLNWSDISSQPSFLIRKPWTDKVLKQYAQLLDWDKLSSNKSLPWSISFIESFQEKWNWDELSKNDYLPWSKELIEEFKSLWNWNLLCRNTRLYRTRNGYIFRKFIEDFEDHIEWNDICLNPRLPWKSHWYEIGFNNPSIFENYAEKLDWYLLSMNPELPWNYELMELYEDKIDWDNLIENPGVEWTIKMTDRFSSHFEWEGKYMYDSKSRNYYSASKLSKCNHIPFSVETLKKYTREWKSGSVEIRGSEYHPYPGEWVYFSDSKFLNREILEEFSAYMCWERICSNVNIKWIDEMLIKFNDKIEIEHLIDHETGRKAILKMLLNQFYDNEKEHS